jgi:hypothetical protein
MRQDYQDVIDYLDSQGRNDLSKTVICLERHNIKLKAQVVAYRHAVEHPVHVVVNPPLTDFLHGSEAYGVMPPSVEEIEKLGATDGED